MLQKKASLLTVFLILLFKEACFATPPAGIRVIYFLDPECPITQSYMLELRNIAKDYASKNVVFEAYFPAYTKPKNVIHAFLRKYNIPFRGYPDKDHSHTKRYGATTMPEVVVVNELGVVVYQGAIDNRYYALGKSRPKATEYFLRNAIHATLEGNMVLNKKTVAFGCLIND